MHRASRPTSGAEELLTSGADVIAGLVGAIYEAKRARDMREYPFWARISGIMETVLFPAPGKILRDSPAACRAPKKE